jgi:hypothetical protein
MVSSLRWSEEDWAKLDQEMAEDEAERVRAAEALADWKMMQNWELYNSTLNPPSDSICSSMYFMTRRVVSGTDAVQKLLRDFWKERV